MKTGLSLTAALLLASTSAFAAEKEVSMPSAQVTPFLTAAYAFGGDDMGSLEYEGGGSSDVAAGGGYTLGGGFKFEPMEQPFEKPIGVFLSANYHADSATADNADITFDRFEFNVLPFVQLNEMVHVAAGVGFHTGVEFSYEFNSDSFSVEYDSAMALIVEIGFQTSEQFSWGIRATSVDYEYKGNGGSLTTDGNNLGAYFNYYFKQ